MMKKAFSRTQILAILAVLLFATASICMMRPISAEELPRDQTLYMDIQGGTVANPNLFNPFVTGVFYDQGLGGNCIEFLAYPNLCNGTIIPWLASGWNSSADFMTWTVTLRPGITWSDGYVMNADDVVFTYNMLAQYGSQLAWGTDVQAEVAHVTEIDALTIKFDMTTPNPRFISSNAFSNPPFDVGLVVVPKHIWEGQNPTTFLNNPPIFTGPYTLVSSAPNRFVWKRNDNYWAAKTGLASLPKPLYVVWTAFGTEEERANQMEANNLDEIHYPAPGVIVKLKQDMGDKLVTWNSTGDLAFGDPCPNYVTVNNLIYPFSLPEVRWALSYSINRTDVALLAYKGWATPIPSLYPSYGGLVDNYLSKISDLFTTYPATEYNPDKTAQIFTSLGYTKGGDGIWVTPNGTRLAGTMIGWAGMVALDTNTAAIAGYFRAAGVDVVEKYEEFGPYQTDVASGNYNFACIWCCGSMTEPLATFQTIYTTGYFRPIGNTTGWWTDTEHWSNSTFDSYVDKMKVISPDDPNTLTYFRSAMEIWLQQLPGIPNSFKPMTSSTSNVYWTGWPTAANPYIQPLYHWPNFLFALLRLTQGTGPTSSVSTSSGLGSVPTEWVIAIVVVLAVVVLAEAVVLMRARRARERDKKP